MMIHEHRAEYLATLSDDQLTGLAIEADELRKRRALRHATLGEKVASLEAGALELKEEVDRLRGAPKGFTEEEVQDLTAMLSAASRDSLDVKHHRRGMAALRHDVNRVAEQLVHVMELNDLAGNRSALEKVCGPVAHPSSGIAEAERRRGRRHVTARPEDPKT